MAAYSKLLARSLPHLKTIKTTCALWPRCSDFTSVGVINLRSSAKKNNIMAAKTEIVQNSGSSIKSNKNLFKWALVGVIVAGASYWAFKKYR